MKKILFFLFFLAACSSEKEQATAQKHVRLAFSAEVQTIDPQIAQGVPASHILRQITEGLYIDSGADGALEPGVAKSHTISADGLTYTFSLRKSLWSDGSPLTAHDFVYTLKRAVSPSSGSKYSFLLFPIKNAEEISSGKLKADALGVKAVDDYTLEITLRSPTPYFLASMTHSIASPVKKSVVEKHGIQWTKPQNIVTNGAYKLVEWVPNSKMEFVRNSNFWDDKNTKIDAFTISIITKNASQIRAYKSNEIDMTDAISSEQYKRLIKEMPEIMRVRDYLGSYYYGINPVHNKALQDVRVRKALSLTVKREEITDNILGSGEKASYYYVPKGMAGYAGYDYPFKDTSYEKRIEEAQNLMKEAGFSKENPLTLNLVYNTNENHKRIAIALRSMFQDQLPVTITLENVEWKVFLGLRQNHDPRIDLFRAGWIGDYPDPFSFLEQFQMNSGLNDIGFKDPSYDALLKQSFYAKDSAERFSLLADAEKKLLDSYLLLPIYQYVSKHVVRPTIIGMEDNPLDHYFISDWDLK